MHCQGVGEISELLPLTCLEAYDATSIYTSNGITPRSHTVGQAPGLGPLAPFISPGGLTCDWWAAVNIHIHI